MFLLMRINYCPIFFSEVDSVLKEVQLK